MMGSKDSKKLVLVKKVREDAIVPAYAKPGDSGFDLIAVEDVFIEPGETAVIPTGLAFGIPEGYEIQIRPRSGVTSKSSLRVQLGTIDSGYIGEVHIIADNVKDAEFQFEYALDDGIRIGKEHSHLVYTVDNRWTHDKYSHVDGTIIVHKGDKIAQGVLVEVPKADFFEVHELEDTARGTAGFGSTGV